MIRRKGLISFLVAGLFFSGCSGASTAGISGKAGSGCPSVSRTEKILDLGRNGKVIQVRKSPVKGLCEVVIELPDERKTIVYIDQEGRHFIAGRIFDVRTKRDLTMPRLVELNKDWGKRNFSKAEMKELEGMVAFTYGDVSNPERVVYLITDPDCPFCRRADIILKALADEGKLGVKVILYPLEPIHPHAKEKAVALICDRKGMKELVKGYRSGNQCRKGLEMVKKVERWMLDHKVMGAPAVVYPDGELRLGVQSADYILKRLGEKSRK